MRKLKYIILVALALGLAAQLQAQFPHMGVEGTVIYFKPLYYDIAIGASRVPGPATRLYIRGGQVQVESRDDGQLLQLDCPGRFSTGIRQSDEAGMRLTDWSPLAGDFGGVHYFGLYRYGAIQSAVDLFGHCSPEFATVIAAREAVGLPSESPYWGYGLHLCGSLSPGTYNGINSLTAGRGGMFQALIEDPCKPSPESRYASPGGPLPVVAQSLEPSIAVAGSSP